MVAFNDLAVSYGAYPAVSGASGAIRAGGFVVCTGVSGSGKSTLARAITNTLPKVARSTGSIQVNGRAIGIWQEPSLSFTPFRRLGEQVADVLRARQANPQEAAELLSSVGLAERAGAYPCELSGGQIQRAALARALATDPQLLVADEPTSSLDPATEADIVSLVESLRLQKRFAVLWITHRPAAVAALASQHWHLEEGRLQTGQAAAPLASAVPAAESRKGELGDARLRARSLHKAYRVPVIRDVSVDLHAGETLVLRGASGSGKSTLARMLAGIESPDSGSIERRGDVQLVWSDPATSLNPRWPVVDVIAEPLQIRGEGRLARRGQALLWMEKMQLPAASADRRVTELSGGERRRVSIARALITSPSCVIFDEATNGLDRRLSDEIVDLLAEWQQESKAAYLWITHDEESGRRLAGRQLTMAEGRLRPDA